MSWDQLRSIYQDAREQAVAGREIEALVCPNDGEILTQGPNGTYRCKFDGYEPINQPRNSLNQ